MTKAIVVLADSKQAKKLGASVKRASADIDKSVDLSFAHDDYDYITVIADKPKDKHSARELGGNMFKKYKDKASSLQLDDALGFGNDILEGADLAGYTFEKYKSTPDTAKLTSVTVGDKDIASVSQSISESIRFARDLVSEPGNVIYPATYAARLQRILTPLGITVKVYHQAQLEEMGLNLLLSVGQGSEKDSYVVVMEWMNGKEGEQPVALVGKGVTFDTGGISLKPGRGMGDMKYDMGGSAATVGAMHAIGLQKLKRNVVGIVGLVENMPDGKAIKPGDVVTSLSGQTVENLNTDAEGRLVLADILTFVQNEYNPSTVINLATLTGAIVATLGKQMAGLFTNSTDLEKLILQAGKGAGEGFFRMPMGPNWAKMIDSPIADMQNIGGPYGGSTTAAEFLYKFVDNHRAWAHLDIAGMAWEDKGKPTTPKGAVGFGVRTLFNFVNQDGTIDLKTDGDMDY
ncbi:leucyl aminopeptidase [bacterium]|nr:leucyl aminopeptidase [bacterium]